MKREKFLELPVEEVSKNVRASGSQVCVFPFNGTRRWFLLEHGQGHYENSAQAYVDLTSKRYIEMYKMLFDHGLDTIISPVFGGDILSRGNEYMEQIGIGMRLLAEHTDFLSFYQTYDVRVHFYGDYRKAFTGTPYAYLTGLFDDVTKRTANHKAFRLFYGVFASDATATIAESSVKYHQKTGRIPSRRELIEEYYGEYVEKASLFIGFEKFAVFDYPMLGQGEENIYFTVAPSLYMTAGQLRSILYDHIYLRPMEEPDYAAMRKENILAMGRYYQMNREVVLGVGEIHAGIWYPKLEIRDEEWTMP